MNQTDSETLSQPAARDAKPTPPGARRGVLRRVVDWYLCRPALEHARRAAQMSPRETELLERSKAALAAGNLLREPSDPAGRQLAVTHAAAHYADALHWVLWSSHPDVAQPSGEALWTEAHGAQKFPGLDAEQAATVGKLLAVPHLAVELAERTAEAQDAAAALLKRATLSALDTRERAVRTYDALSITAFARVTLTVLVLVAAVAAAIVLRPPKPNLALGKSWKTSSSLFECHPAQAECGGAKTRIFFHTKEEMNPWFEYDLGSKVAFSSLTIENRQDGEGARAVPLVVEVGDDDTHFTEVAQRKDSFGTWNPSFPKQHARYVRLRVPRRSMLHLENVEVHP